ncbi:thioredoxin family protein [Brevibacillus sp. TJ4]|uniref:thioredoxin family protein n=1 Tax=Brevibacillus sp. TJ4 TaxID=3234853 RepID=UPI0037D2568D
MKKIIVISVIVAALLIAAIVYSDISNREKAAGNPYGKATLHPATLEQLNDPLYDNLIMPEELQTRLANEEDLFVYFYSPICEHCLATTPVLVPLADELGIDLKKHNVLEFSSSWDTYQIEFTPTLVHYVDGKEVDRIVGGQDESVFRSWITEQKAAE